VTRAQREALDVLVEARDWVAGTKRRSISHPRVEVNIRASDALVRAKLAEYRDKAMQHPGIDYNRFVSTYEYRATAAGVAEHTDLHGG
jgi:hypothetical protein